MKRFLLIPSCALVALSVLTSCQKEEKSALELTQELTAELQKVTDYRSAEAVAPRVEVLNKRLQDATVRTVALNGTALLRSDNGDSGAAYADATAKLSREVGRVLSSVPVTTADGEVDRDSLIRATGVAAGTEPTAPAGARKSAGEKFLMHDADKSHEQPPVFAECYGSAKLKEALAYKADPTASPIMKFDSAADVPAIPEAAEVPEEDTSAEDDSTADVEEEEETTAAVEDDEPAAPAADEDEAPVIAADDEEDAPAADDEEDAPAADDEDSSSDSASEDDMDLDFDISVDDL